MPELIDMLTPKLDHCPWFQVNTGALSVNLNEATAGTAEPYFASNTTSKFVRGDSFIILSVGFFVPNGFSLYGYLGAGFDQIPCPIMWMTGKNVGVVGHYSILNFGNDGQFKIPFPNYEFSCGVFVNPEENSLNLAPNFQLEAMFPVGFLLDQPQISMINVPASLNGQRFTVIPFIKVLHNFALTV